ncbi:MAG: alpha/beta fold hydrolase [Steroidobacteraceae bacterium]
MSFDGDTPRLVMLPGLDGTGKLFAEFVRRVGPGVRAQIVMYPRDQPLGYAELEVLVRAALPTDRRYVLLGESFSGPLAIRIAASPPRGLAGVILCGTFAKNPRPWLRWVRPMAVRLPIKSLPRWLRAVLLWGSARAQSAPARADRAMTGVAAAVIRHRIGEILAVDESRRLACIELPILVLMARRDRIVPRAATRWMLNSAPCAQIAEIDGPHLLLQSRPDECAVPILQFLHRWI